MNKVAKLPDNLFESIKHIDPKTGIEYWEARELMPALGYTKWENFYKIINRSQTAVKNSPYDINDCFRKVRKPIISGKNTVQLVDDFELSRYACYIIAMNGDSKKAEIALAQSYFAVQTRKQEIAEIEEKDLKRIEARKRYSVSDRRMSGVIMSRGVDGKGLAKIKSDGDRELFGGRDTHTMKKKYGLKPTDALPDYLSPVVLAAKQLANEITTVNTKEKDLWGVNPIDSEHKTNNRRVRKTLTDSGIKPELLPPEENVKKIERRVNKNKPKQLGAK